MLNEILLKKTGLGRSVSRRFRVRVRVRVRGNLL
jgi:hypothetical protein